MKQNPISIDKTARLIEIMDTPRMFTCTDQPKQTCRYLYEGLVWQLFRPHFHIVEIGSFSGGSTEVFALTCEKVYSIDPYDEGEHLIQETRDGSEGTAKEILQTAEKMFIERMSAYDNVVKIKQSSADAVSRFEDKSLDAVYIDGDHRYESVVDDIRRWMPKLNDDGIISGHDYDDSVVMQAVLDTIGSVILFDDHSWASYKKDIKGELK